MKPCDRQLAAIKHEVFDRVYLQAILPYRRSYIKR